MSRRPAWPERRGRARATTSAWVRVLDDGAEFTRDDVLATEEPLEIRLAAGGEVRPVATTMRTPGADFELAAGFLRTEGVIAGREAIRRIEYCVDGEQLHNTVTVHLAASRLPELSSLERYGTVSSACGVCGKASLDALHLRGVEPLPEDTPAVDRETLFGLPDALRAAQGNFAATGGLHAAGLFTATGDLMVVREDVGRHNAVDKAVGWTVLKGHRPLTGVVMVVSGRAGFEIVQKAVAAGIPVVCAVSAPSSLAVAVAGEFGVTLVGFLRGRRANVYAGGHRLGLRDPASAVP
jgi:FdhD protein